MAARLSGFRRKDHIRHPARVRVVTLVQQGGLEAALPTGARLARAEGAPGLTLRNGRCNGFLPTRAS